MTLSDYTFHEKVDHNYYIGKTTAGPFLTHRQKIIGENVNVWNGRDIFTLLPNNQYYFFLNYRKFDRYRSWSSRIISSHSWSAPHTISQKQSYDCRFMVTIIPVITCGRMDELSGTLAKTTVCCRGYKWDINGNL